MSKPINKEKEILLNTIGEPLENIETEISTLSLKDLSIKYIEALPNRFPLKLSRAERYNRLVGSAELYINSHFLRIQLTERNRNNNKIEPLNIDLLNAIIMSYNINVEDDAKQSGQSDWTKVVPVRFLTGTTQDAKVWHAIQLILPKRRSHMQFLRNTQLEIVNNLIKSKKLAVNWITVTQVIDLTSDTVTEEISSYYDEE